jgi:hypothetical protein
MLGLDGARERDLDEAAAWSAAGNEQRFLGQHGGLHEAETSTYLAWLTD